MLFRETVEFTHMALGLVSKAFNTIDMVVTVGKELRMVDTKVVDVRYIQHVIAAPTDGIYDAVHWLVDEFEENR